MAPSRKFVSSSEAKAPYFVGVDVGGTNIKIGVVDDLGRPLSATSIHSEVEKGPQAAIERAAEAIDQLLAEAGLKRGQIARIGLGSPGTMDVAKGIFLEPGNLPGWWHFPLRDALSKAAGLEVTFSNDAAAAAFGEFWVGSGKGLHSMVMFTLGTGVGGGIIIGELMIEGENSAGSELGHMIIDYHDDARQCSCGQRGHLEAYANASSVVQRTEEGLQRSRESTLRTRLAGGEELTPLLVDQEAERGDALALEVVLDTARYLGIGMVTAMHTIDPQGVVIGGAMTFGQHATATGRKFLERVKEEVAARAFPALARKTTIDYASLGGDAGFIGAAGRARHDYLKKHV